MMFLMAFGEIAVSRIQIAKQCLDIFLQVLIFTVWDSFANKKKKLYIAKISAYMVAEFSRLVESLAQCLSTSSPGLLASPKQELGVF